MQRIQDQSRNGIPPGTVIESIFANFLLLWRPAFAKSTTCVIIGLFEGLDKLEMDVLLALSIGNEILVILAHFLNFQFSAKNKIICQIYNSV